MRFLYVTDRLPLPPLGGRARRVHAVGQELVRRGHEVELFAVLPVEPVSLETLQAARMSFVAVHQIQIPRSGSTAAAPPLGSEVQESVTWPFRRPEVIRAARRVVGRQSFDGVIFDGLEAASLRRHLPRSTACAIDIDRPTVASTGPGGLRRALSRALERWSQRREERRTLESVSLVVARHREDRDLLQRQAPSARLVIVGDGVYEPESPPNDAQGKRLVIAGAFGEADEIDGLKWFANDVLPRIRERHPDVEAVFLAQEPDADLLALRQLPGVQLIDTREIGTHLDSAAIVCVPNRFGASASGSILEGMIRQRAVVSTVNAARGLEVEDGRHLLLAPGEEGFATRCCKLLERPDVALALAREGRSWCLSRALWPIALRPLEPLVGWAMSSPKPLPAIDLVRPTSVRPRSPS
ncbi:MAG: glycosyltransferase [Planctomycetota bacterium]